MACRSHANIHLKYQAANTCVQNRGYALQNSTKNDQNNNLAAWCLTVNDYRKSHTKVRVANAAQTITLHQNYKWGSSFQILSNTHKESKPLW